MPPDPALLRDAYQDPVVSRSDRSGLVILRFIGSNIQTLGLPPLPGAPGKDRDLILRRTPRAEAMWAAALRIAITKMASLSWEVDGDVPLRVRRAQELLTGVDGWRGWVTFISKQVRDFLTTDNGAFFYIQRASEGYASKVVGLWHLDSLRCFRTGDWERPVIYLHPARGPVELKWYQVVAISDMPEADAEAFETGFCAASAAYGAITRLAAIEQYIIEKVTGSRPQAIHIVSGISTEAVQDIVRQAREQQRNQGRVIFLDVPVLGTVDPGAAVNLATIPLAELPDGFNRIEEFQLAVRVYANAIGLDEQELQPLTGQALGTGAQSMVLHEKEQGKGLAAWRQMWMHAINWFVLPDAVEFAFHERDERDRKQKADNDNTRAAMAAMLTERGVISAQEAKQYLVDEDVLPREFIKEDITPHESLSDSDKPHDGAGATRQEGQLQDETPVQAVGTAAAAAAKAQDVGDLGDLEDDDDLEALLEAELNTARALAKRALRQT